MACMDEGLSRIFQIKDNPLKIGKALIRWKHLPGIHAEGLSNPVLIIP